MDGGTGWPPLGQVIPADPYDEDHYCEWCGYGAWRSHGAECAWADALADGASVWSSLDDEPWWDPLQGVQGR